ncbi:hypothetical protein [Aestuariivirga sp.]|uniref:hypothetical protein n=1 Tax=Aestuariivirga sp. TaxID=2650926 RepID=UPI003BAA2F04
MSLAGIIGALIFLGLGMAELVLVKQSAYPALRWRYEKAKTTQSQGLSPSTIMAVVQFQCLILMPVLGYLLGNRMTSMFG